MPIIDLLERNVISLHFQTQTKSSLFEINRDINRLKVNIIVKFLPARNDNVAWNKFASRVQIFIATFLPTLFNNLAQTRDRRNRD